MANWGGARDRDIRELKQTDAAFERRRSHSNLYSIQSD